MIRKNILLSIQPVHAEKIFNGTKKVELRRQCPRVNRGDLVFVYVSTPVKALLGTFQIDRIVEDRPYRLWPIVRQKAGITRKQFYDYYSGADTGYGIFLRSTRKYSCPINLDHLRTVWMDFHPPQSFLYLTIDQVKQVESLGERALEHFIDS